MFQGTMLRRLHIGLLSWPSISSAGDASPRGLAIAAAVLIIAASCARSEHAPSAPLSSFLTHDMLLPFNG